MSTRPAPGSQPSCRRFPGMSAAVPVAAMAADLTIRAAAAQAAGSAHVLFSVVH